MIYLIFFFKLCAAGLRKLITHYSVNTGTFASGWKKSYINPIHEPCMVLLVEKTTSTDLFLYINYIFGSMNKKVAAHAICTNFNKAFDKVN